MSAGERVARIVLRVLGVLVMLGGLAGATLCFVPDSGGTLGLAIRLVVIVLPGVALLRWPIGPVAFGWGVAAGMLAAFGIVDYPIGRAIGDAWQAQALDAIAIGLTLFVFYAPVLVIVAFFIEHAIGRWIQRSRFPRARIHRER